MSAACVFQWLWSIVTDSRFLVALAIDWAIGICFIQYFYYRTRKLRALDAETRAKAAPFIQQTEKWNWFTNTFCISHPHPRVVSVFFIPRFLGLLGISSGTTLLVSLVLLGSKEKTTGWRKTLLRILERVSGWVAITCGSYVWISHSDLDVDYTKWLGEGYAAKAPKGRPPVIISCHRAWSVYIIFIT